MLFSHFAAQLAQIEPISARLQITALLAELFGQLQPEECPAAFNLIQGQLLPPYAALEFQMSDKMVVRSLARLADRYQLLAKITQSHGQVQSSNLFGEEDFSSLEDQIRQIGRQTGDIGLTTEKILSQKENPLDQPLTLNQVYDQLLQIGRVNGVGSQETKVDLLARLLDQLDALSARFIARIVVGKMRLGFSSMTILDAMSWAMTGGKAESALLEITYQKKADLSALAATYLFIPDSAQRSQALRDYSVEVGVPVVAALCQRLNSATDIIAKMDTVLAEPKYDGMRVQIHFSRENSLIKAFTRNHEDVSHMFPELQQLPTLLSNQIQSCILDSEAVGVDLKTGHLLAFQETITRKRKHDVAEKAAAIPMRFYIFDLLLLNGQSQLEHPLFERKQTLEHLFTDNDTFVQAPVLKTSDADQLRHFHEEKLRAGLEGVVAKQIDAVYQPGRKGWSWVKIKEEEGTRGKLNDTLDLIVMGYYAGKGKRLDFGLGAFLVGVRDEQSGDILSISKIGTGLTDDQFREMKRRCQPLETNQQPAIYQVNKNLAPDVWILPAMVVEIAADEITNSSLHTSQVSLRFPRLIRWRDDKTIDQATSLTELEKIKIA